MKEIWKDIPNYEGIYKISNYGRVKSFYLHRGTTSRILKPRKVKDGYLMIALYKNKKCKNYQVHQLVAKVFLSNKFNYNEINHKDLDKTNNCISNLEWISRKDNVHHYWLNKERRLV